MNQTINVQSWLEARKDEILEVSRLPVKEQLEAIEKAGSGVGFVFVLTMTSTDTESEFPQATHVDLTSIPVLRVRGEWVTVEDDNLLDILAGVIRMVAPNISEASDGDAKPTT